MSDIRIVIADDHASLRESLASYLNGERGLRVVGQACDGLEALRAVALHHPHVLLLDLAMPTLAGLGVLKELRQQPDPPRVVVLSMHNSDSYRQAAQQEGAWAYVLKEATTSEVVRAIRDTHAGQGIAMAAVPTKGVGNTTREDGLHSLSGRESEVLTLVARGYTSKEIATHLQVAKTTVDTYRMRIADKLGVRGRAELVRLAVRAGLLPPDDPS